jgi:DNA-binding beta-propeller fold protein YncE
MHIKGLSLAALAAVLLSAAGSGYHVIRKIAVGGEGGWDYITFDPDAPRLFVAHATRVDVVDPESGKVIGEIADTPGVHGIALVPEAGKGFISNGKTDNVTVFDLKTLRKVGHVATGKKPDAIVYDDATRLVLVSDGDSNDLTVIDPFRTQAVGKIALGGAPEFIAGDGKGTVWVNLEDKNETLTLDPASLAVKKRFPLAGCDGPSSLAMDRATRRLFIGCANKVLTVLDADDGKVVAQLPIGEHVDATVFDPERRLVFSSNGDGTVTVVREDAADKFRVVETIATARGAKTMAIDLKSKRLYLPTAEGLPPSATGPPRPNGPQFAMGRFVVLVVGL